jgi:hypothetical protein
LTGATAKDELQAFVHAVLTVQLRQLLIPVVSNRKCFQMEPRQLVHETHEQQVPFADLSISGSEDRGGTHDIPKERNSSRTTAKGWHVEERVYLDFVGEVGGMWSRRIKERVNKREMVIGSFRRDL